jgi:hypothetical protein
VREGRLVRRSDSSHCSLAACRFAQQNHRLNPWLANNTGCDLCLSWLPAAAAGPRSTKQHQRTRTLMRALYLCCLEPAHRLESSHQSRRVLVYARSLVNDCAQTECCKKTTQIAHHYLRARLVLRRPGCLSYSGTLWGSRRCHSQTSKIAGHLACI